MAERVFNDESNNNNDNKYVGKIAKILQKAGPLREVTAKLAMDSRDNAYIVFETKQVSTI